MMAYSLAVLQRGTACVMLLALSLISTIVAVPTAGAAVTYSVFAGPCPGDPPPPPPQCGDQPCPTLPGTGGGGGACETDPTDPACRGGTTIPRPLVVTSRADALNTGTAHMLGERDANTIVLQPVLVIHPCPGDPPPGGNEPVPAPPPPPIPVCAACEAPGVAASVEIPAVTVRMNPETGLVNLQTWFWAEGYRGQDLVASRSWSAPYEPTTIEVRYSVKRYIWNFGDGGQIESKSLGQAYPASSEIANAYGWSSRTEPGGVFHPGLAIEWNVEYRVNGGAPQALPPVTRAYPAVYPVQELQPIITNP